MKTLDDLKREVDDHMGQYQRYNNDHVFCRSIVNKTIDHLHAQGRILPDGYAMQLDGALDAVRYLLPLAKGYVATNPGIRSTECIIEDAEAMIAAAQKVGG